MQTLTALACSQPAPRYDIYRNIHRALRACMGATLAQIGAIDVQDANALQAGLTQLRELLALCSAHIEKETHFLHVAMEARRPGSSAGIAAEHDEHRDTLNALDELAAIVESTEPAARATLMHRLYLQLALFVAENFEHMHVEEIEHNAVLWSNYTDAELLELEGRIVASIPPQEKAVVFRWMLPSIDQATRVMLLRGIEQQAPREVFEAMLGLARECLGVRDWEKLEAALMLARAA